MIHNQLVFTESIFLFDAQEVTTDLGRTVAEIDQNIFIPLDEGQELTAVLIGGCFSRVGGFDPFSQAKVELFVNGRKLFEQGWPFGRTEPICLDINPPPEIFKVDGTANLIKVRFTQSPLDGLNRWSFQGNLIYNGNTEESPTIPPSVEPPIINPDPTEGQSRGPLEQLSDALFGDAKKTATTIAVIAVVLGGAVIAISLSRKSPQARSIRIAKAATKAAI